MYFADMHLEIFLADFAVFRVFWGISRDFAEIPEFRGSATARIIRSPVLRTLSFRNLGIDLLKYSFFVVKMTPSHLVSNLFCIKDFCMNKTTFFNVPKCFDGPLSSSVSYSVKLPLNVEGVHCYKVCHIALTLLPT